MRALVAKHGATVAIIALLVLNVVLIVPLITHRGYRPNDAAAGGTPTTSTVTPSPSPSSPSPTPSATSPSVPPALISNRPREVLAVNSDQVAWRAEASGCGQDSKIEVTTDGGKTWRVTDSGLKSVVRLRAFGDSSVFAIGADDSCDPVYAVDASPDDQWQQDSSMLSDTWFRMPKDLNTVHDPKDKTSKPCGTTGLVDFAGLGDVKGAALCADGSLRSWDGGKDWTTIVEHSDAIALNADDNHFVMVERSSQCDGLSTQRFNLHDGKLRMVKKAHCFKIPHPARNDVAVSNHGTTVWVWSGDFVKTN